MDAKTNYTINNMNKTNCKAYFYVYQTFGILRVAFVIGAVISIAANGYLIKLH